MEKRQVVLTEREIEVMREMALARKDDAIGFKLNLTEARRGLSRSKHPEKAERA